jgi:hypothetical protein
VMAVKYKLSMKDLIEYKEPAQRLARLLFRHTASVLLVVNMFDVKDYLVNHGLLCNLVTGMQLIVYSAKDGYEGRRINEFWKDTDINSNVAFMTFHAPLNLDPVELYQGV